MEIKRQYKIIFPTGYLNTNIENSNIDINLIFEDGESYFGTLITVENIRSFIKREDLYFWTTDMLVVRDLKKETIEQVISDIVSSGIYIKIFDNIGFLFEESFEEIIHLNDLAFILDR